MFGDMQQWSASLKNRTEWFSADDVYLSADVLQRGIFSQPTMRGCFPLPAV